MSHFGNWINFEGHQFQPKKSRQLIILFNFSQQIKMKVFFFFFAFFLVWASGFGNWINLEGHQFFFFLKYAINNNIV